METKEIENKIIELTTKRFPKTICPSEVLPHSLKKDKAMMELVRKTAVKLVEKEIIVIMQKNEIVDPKLLKGPIRLRLK